VPDGAQSGAVVLRSNGVASNALQFQVIAFMRVTPEYAGLFVGDRQAFEVEALDPLGEIVRSPFFVWELGAGYLGTIGANGDLTTREVGWSDVRARSGKVTGVAAVGVTPYQVSPNTERITSDSGAVGQIVARPEGLYYAHPDGGRIYFEPLGGPRVVLAGSGENGSVVEGVPARDARLNMPDGLAVDAAGNLYFSERESHLVRVIPRSDTSYGGRLLKAGRLYTVAGNGLKGFSGDEGPATQASLNAPAALVLGNEGGLLEGGSLLVTDGQNARIREVANDGTIRTLVGGGGWPIASAGLAARSFGGSVGAHLARDAVGNLAFPSGPQILFYCRVPGHYFGRSMSAGQAYRVAGNGETGFDGDGHGTSVRLWSPQGVAFNTQGDLFFAEAGTDAVRVLRTDGALRWIAGNKTSSASRMTLTSTEVAPATSVRLDPYCLGIRSDGSLLLGESTRLNFYDLRLRMPWPPQTQ